MKNEQVMKNNEGKYSAIIKDTIAQIATHKSNLRQEFCKVYTYQAKWKKALDEISEDIHETVLRYGPFSINSYKSFHLLCEIQIAQYDETREKNKVLTVFKTYEQMVANWLHHLTENGGNLSEFEDSNEILFALSSFRKTLVFLMKYDLIGITQERKLELLFKMKIILKILCIHSKEDFEDL